MAILSHPKPPDESEGENEDTDDGGVMTVVEERARMFMGMGFEAKPALLLSVGGASPSAVRELLRKGCPPDTVVRIVL